MKSIPGPWMMVLLTSILAACSRNPEPSKYQVSTISSCRLPIRPAELRACVRGLAFDTLELTGDEQRLMVCKLGTCGYGPLAKIQPEESSYEGDLRTGRIIARIYLSPGEKDRYDKLGLAPGDTTYWWVQKDEGRNEGKSYYLTVSGDSLVRKFFTMKFEPYRGVAPRQALARWLWVEDDEKTQGGCPSGTCK